MKFADENGSLEVIIYVIVMVVGLAASAYRNYVKRKEKQQGMPEDAMPGFPETAFDTVFESAEPIREEPFQEEIHELEGFEKEISEEEAFALETYEESAIDADYSEPTFAKEQPALIIAGKPVDEVVANVEGQSLFGQTKELLSDDFLKSLRKDLSNVFDADDFENEEIQDNDEIQGFDLKKAIIYSEIMNPKYL